MTARRAAGLVRPAVVGAGLVACVLAVFALVYVVSSLVGDGAPGSGAWLGATALVALLVPVARPRLDRLGDRVAFGRDGDPYAVMTRFVQQVTEALAIDDVLPHLAQTATSALHGARGEARLWLADGSEARQTWPPDGAAVREDVGIRLKHDGHSVGRLGVQVSSDELSATDREILDHLAGPAGLALANVQLTYELRRRLAQETELAHQVWLSRQRLLDAASGQQSRFAGAVAQRVERPLDIADRALDAVAAGDASALSWARRATQQALDALRDLAAGLFPAALAERGLANALELYLQQRWTAVRLDAPADWARLPLSVEAAGYFCAVALIDEVAESGPASVRLLRDDLALQVRMAAGTGPSPETALLVRDRAEAAGGSLHISTGGGRSVARVVIPLDDVGLGEDPMGAGAR